MSDTCEWCSAQGTIGSANELIPCPQCSTPPTVGQQPVAEGAITAEVIDYHRILDTCGNVGIYPTDDEAQYIADCLVSDVKQAITRRLALARTAAPEGMVMVDEREYRDLVTLYASHFPNSPYRFSAVSASGADHA